MLVGVPEQQPGDQRNLAPGRHHRRQHQLVAALHQGGRQGALGHCHQRVHLGDNKAPQVPCRWKLCVECRCSYLWPRAFSGRTQGVYSFHDPSVCAAIIYLPLGGILI